jgi:hypothetical protein
MFINLAHQRQPVAVAEHLAATAAGAAGVPTVFSEDGRRQDRALQEAMSVHFLVPCHSTPFADVIHAPVELRQLDCSPWPRLGAAAGVRRRAALAQHLEPRVPECVWSTVVWPALSETDAWLHDPARFLLAAYGPDPRPPAVCDASAAAAPTATTRTGSPRVAHAAHPHPASWSLAQEPPRADPDDATFLTLAAGFAASYLDAAARRGCDVAGRYRQLPSHIVMTVESALLPDVRAFLDAQHYQPAPGFARFAEPAGPRGQPRDPEALLVFAHHCWHELTKNATGVPR